MTDNTVDIIKPIPRPALSKTGKAIEYYVEDGREMRKYVESGVIQAWSEDKRKWLFVTGTAKNTITTSEQAKELVNSRWEATREASLRGMIAGTEAASEPEAIARLSQVFTEHAIRGGKGGASYADKVIQMAELVRPRDRVKATDAAGNSLEAGSLGELIELGQQLRQLRARKVSE